MPRLHCEHAERNKQHVAFNMLAVRIYIGTLVPRTSNINSTCLKQRSTCAQQAFNVLTVQTRPSRTLLARNDLFVVADMQKECSKKSHLVY